VEIKPGSIWYPTAIMSVEYIDEKGRRKRTSVRPNDDGILVDLSHYIVDKVENGVVFFHYEFDVGGNKINSYTLEAPVQVFLDSNESKRDRDIKFMQGLQESVPAPGKKRAAVIIGRFNPPTKGHYELINEVKKFIKNNPNLKLEAMPVVVVIGNDKKRKDADDLLKNPLTVHDRVVFMQSSGHANGVKFITATNAFEALGKCRSEGLEPIAIAAGTDRIDDYIRILDQYFKDANDKPIKHEKIHLARDEGAIETKKAAKADNIDDQLSSIRGGEEVTTDIVSGSLARRAAELGYFDEFAKITGLDHNKKLATLLYNKVKKVLDLANQQNADKGEE